MSKETLAGRVIGAIRASKRAEELTIHAIKAQLMKDLGVEVDLKRVKPIMVEACKFSRFDITHFNSQDFLNCWRYVFSEYVEKAVLELEKEEAEYPGTVNLSKLHAKYGTPKVKVIAEEPYDNLVEDIYLTAVNDRKTYEVCLNEVQELMLARKDQLPPGKVRYLVKAKCRVAREQCKLIWDKVFGHLTEAAIYQLEHECNRTEEEIEEIKRHYVPGYNQGTSPSDKSPDELLQEITEHLKPANKYFSKLEVNMSNQYVDKPITHVTYVYGENITEMSAEELMKAIKRAQGEIKELTEAGVKSEYISKTITDINSAIGQMVEALDAL